MEKDLYPCEMNKFMKEIRQLNNDGYSIMLKNNLVINYNDVIWPIEKNYTDILNMKTNNIRQIIINNNILHNQNIDSNLIFDPVNHISNMSKPNFLLGLVPTMQYNTKKLIIDISKRNIFKIKYKLKIIIPEIISENEITQDLSLFPYDKLSKLNIFKIKYELGEISPKSKYDNNDNQDILYKYEKSSCEM